jgi:hypothetical protein
LVGRNVIPGAGVAVRVAVTAGVGEGVGEDGCAIVWVGDSRAIVRAAGRVGAVVGVAGLGVGRDLLPRPEKSGATAE